MLYTSVISTAFKLPNYNVKHVQTIYWRKSLKCWKQQVFLTDLANLHKVSTPKPQALDWMWLKNYSLLSLQVCAKSVEICKCDENSRTLLYATGENILCCACHECTDKEKGVCSDLDSKKYVCIFSCVVNLYYQSIVFTSLESIILHALNSTINMYTSKHS